MINVTQAEAERRGRLHALWLRDKTTGEYADFSKVTADYEMYKDGYLEGRLIERESPSHVDLDNPKKEAEYTKEALADYEIYKAGYMEGRLFEKNTSSCVDLDNPKKEEIVNTKG